MTGPAIFSSVPRAEKLTFVALALVGLGLAAFFSFWANVALLTILVSYAGLPSVLCAVALTAHGIWGVWKKHNRTWLGIDRRASLYKAGLVWLVCSVIAATIFPKGYRVLMDEVVVLATSKAIHEERQAITPSRLDYAEGGILKLSGGYIDKRPFLFATYVALFHDILGYSPRNAFYANMSLAAAVLALLFLLGSRLGGSAGAGVVAMVAMTAVPLFAQNASGGGIDVINLFSLALLFLTCSIYAEEPSEAAARAMLGAGILLAYSRYESALYFIVPLVLSFFTWARRGRCFWDLSTVLFPLASIALLGVHYITFCDAASRFQYSDRAVSETFSFSFFSFNFSHALNFFLDCEHTLCNSPFVFVAGLSAFLLLLVSRFKQGWRRLDGQDLCFWLYAGLVGTSFLLLMCYSWGQLDQIIASRLSLPLFLFFALCAARACRSVSRPRIVVPGLVAAFAFAAYWTVPPVAEKDYSVKMFPLAGELALFDEFRDRQPDQRFAIINGFSNFWMTRDVYCISGKSLNSNLDFLSKMLSSAEFRHIYYIETQKKNNAGKFITELSDRVDGPLDLELISDDVVVGELRVKISLIKPSSVPLIAAWMQKHPSSLQHRK